MIVYLFTEIIVLLLKINIYYVFKEKIFFSFPNGDKILSEIDSPFFSYPKG